MARTKKLVKRTIEVCRQGVNDYDLIRFDYRTSDGLLVFHNIYKGLSRKEAYDLKREIMEN